MARNIFICTSNELADTHRYIGSLRFFFFKLVYQIVKPRKACIAV